MLAGIVILKMCGNELIEVPLTIDRSPMEIGSRIDACVLEWFEQF
jgi:hypothetical protein